MKSRPFSMPSVSFPLKDIPPKDEHHTSPTCLLTHWRELFPLDILRDGRVKVLGIALINAVDVTFLLDLHILIHHYEFSNGL